MSIVLKNVVYAGEELLQGPSFVGQSVSVSQNVFEFGQVRLVLGCQRLGRGGHVHQTKFAAFHFNVFQLVSEDEIIDPLEDTLLGTRVLSNLSIGSSSSANTTVQLPPNAALTAWRIGVIADDLEAQAESDESNNNAVDPEAHVIQ